VIQKQTEMMAQQNRLLEPLSVVATIQVLEYQRELNEQVKQPERAPIGFKQPSNPD
jgi:hypothetical protein